MQYRKKIFIFLIISTLFYMNEVKALEVSETNLTIKKGETKEIELYANVPSDTKKVNFSLIFFNYDVTGTFESSIGTLTRNGTTYSISLNEPITGRVKIGKVKIKTSKNMTIDQSAINLHNANAILVDETTKQLNSQRIQVNIAKEEIKEEIKEINKNLLKTISSNIINISLEPDKYEYEFSVNNKIDKLDLIATAIDETYNIDITDQTLKEGNNQIFITVSKGEISEKYTINITREEKKELPEEKTELNKEKESKIQNINFKSGWTTIIIGLIIVFIIGLSMMFKK